MKRAFFFFGAAAFFRRPGLAFGDRVRRRLRGTLWHVELDLGQEADGQRDSGEKEHNNENSQHDRSTALTGQGNAENAAMGHDRLDGEGDDAGDNKADQGDEENLDDYCDERRFLLCLWNGSNSAGRLDFFGGARRDTA